MKSAGTIISVLFGLVLGGLASVSGQTPPPDTTRRTDVVDTTKAPPRISLDSLAKLASAHKTVRKVIRFSGFDTLVAYFVPARLNVQELIARSSYHDAGDYFRFDPSYFVLDYEDVPMRKTVQPYGLIGDRLSVLQNDLATHPFEHTVEPDGMVDMNDIATTQSQGVYLLPGPMGAILGAQGGAATLLTRTVKPTPEKAHSAFVVDKGTWAYSHVRGRYSRGFSDGRTIDAGVGYRRATGYAGYGDSSYNYAGDFYFPLGVRYGLRATGQLYQRNGPLTVVGPGQSKTIGRNRFDRSARLEFESHDTLSTSRSTIGYEHLRQSSRLTGAYIGNFNLTGHSFFATREWIHDSTVVRISGDGGYLEYDNASANYGRYSSHLSAVMAHPYGQNRLALKVGLGSTERYTVLPSADLVWVRESAKRLWMMSVGYSEQAPTLHELHLPKRSAFLESSTVAYVDSGNAALKRERQAIGSVMLQLGADGNSFNLSAAGGKIFDAINWQPRWDSSDSRITFTPTNDGTTFATATVTKDFRYRDFLRFHGGASYHYIDYASGRTKYYQPDYQAFGGAEIHVYWRQKLIHLWAYGEAVYVGPYDGYFESDLGQQVVINTKVSFAMGNFRFHVATLNALRTVYQMREYHEIDGYSVNWGFVWNFMD